MGVGHSVCIPTYSTAAPPTPERVANARLPHPLQGLLGLGVGVADTAQVSTARAHLDAFSRLTAVPLYRGHTIYHHIDHTFHKLQVGPTPSWGLGQDLEAFACMRLCTLATVRRWAPGGGDLSTCCVTSVQGSIVLVML